MIVSVPERGRSTLTQDQWTALSSDHRFWKLVSDDIVQVEAGHAGKWRLKGTCYVGRASVGGLILQVVEKFQGALEALVRLGVLKAPRVERVPSPVTPSPSSTEILVSIFLEAARAYLSGSKQMQYVQVPDVGAIVRGRLNITRTANLRARGIFHQAAFDRNVVSANVPLNRCVYAALREIERLAKIAEISSSHVATARALRLGLSECLPSVLNVSRGELSELASREAEGRFAGAKAKDVASLAGAILDAAGFGGAEASKRTVERAWFVNLETFFEEAVRRTIRNELESVADVTGPRNRPSLFNPDIGRYRANPDVVISHEQNVLAIGDAKYKDFSNWPAASDIHEIVAHASAYGTSKAILFYPDESNVGIRTFGQAATGCRLWAVGLSFDRMAADVRRGLNAAGIIPAVNQETI